MNIIGFFRKKNSITQEKFANMIGISQPHLANIERGIRKPTPRIAFAIERATSREIKKEWLVFPQEYRKEIEEYLKKGA